MFLDRVITHIDSERCLCAWCWNGEPIGSKGCFSPKLTVERLSSQSYRLSLAFVLYWSSENYSGVRCLFTCICNLEYILIPIGREMGNLRVYAVYAYYFPLPLLFEVLICVYAFYTVWIDSLLLKAHLLV